MSALAKSSLGNPAVATMSKNDETSPTDVPERDKDRPSPFFEAARVSSVGIEMAVATLIGWGIGYWADGKLGTGPWLMLVGLIFGVGAGFNGLIRTTRAVHRREKESHRHEEESN